MARYRLTAQTWLNAPFILVSGPDGKPDGREFFSALMEPGAVVEVADAEHPAVHWEPLDDAARNQVAAFPPIESGSIDALTPLGPIAAEPVLTRQVAELTAENADIKRQLDELRRSIGGPS
jgi:hypothetical protein